MALALVSAKQVEYLVKLGMSRDEAETLSKSAASDAIDKLRSQVKANPASDSQVNYIRSLLAARDVTPEMNEAIEVLLVKGMTRPAASDLIDGLRALAYRPKNGAARKAELEDGMYKIDDTLSTYGYSIFKVYHTVHGANQQVAKQLVADEWGHFSFEYVGKRGLRDLTPEHKLSLEDAKAFGVVYGVCCVCGALLTDENSIRAGIGPVCAGRL